MSRDVATDSPRTLVPARAIASTRGRVWLTGLVATPTVIAIGVVFELSAADDRTDDGASHLVPLSPSIPAQQAERPGRDGAAA